MSYIFVHIVRCFIQVVADICSGSEGKFLIEVRNRDLSWPEEMSTLVTTRVFRQRSNTGPLEKGEL